MTDEKVYTPVVIADQPFPVQDTADPAASSEGSDGTSKTYTQKTIAPSNFPQKLVAHETIGSSLNTKSKKILQEFSFTSSGSIQIGTYENGVSGDIRISPDGLVGRNSSGLVTFAIDGDTGNAVFAGEIQSGSIVTGLVTVGNNNVVIDGDSSRILIYDETGTPRILIGYDLNGF